MQKGLTVQQATEQWVGEFDAIQQGMIQTLMEYEPDDWIEVTVPSVGLRVYGYASEQDGVPDAVFENAEYETPYEYGFGEYGGYANSSNCDADWLIVVL